MILLVSVACVSYQTAYAENLPVRGALRQVRWSPKRDSSYRTPDVRYRMTVWRIIRANHAS